MYALSFKNALKRWTPRPFHGYWTRLESSPLGYRLARGAFWSFSGALVSQGSGLLASVIVAQVLGQVKYGELGIIQSTVDMIGTFAGFGLGLTATKHIAECRNYEPARAGRIISLCRTASWLIGGLMAVLLLFLGPWAAGRLLAAPHLGALLRLSSISLLLGAINGVQSGTLAGLEAFKSVAFINLVSGVTAFLLTVCGAWWWGLRGSVLGLVLSQTINCLINAFVLSAECRRAGIPLAFSGSFREFAILWRFSLPALSSNIFVGPTYWVCNTILVNQPNGYSEMGIFNAANQWFAALLFLPTVLGRAALPILSERIGQNDHEKTKKILSFYLKLNTVIIIPIVLFGCLASSWIMASYGTDFRAAWATLSVVFLTGGLLAVQIPVAQVIVASARMWLGAIMNAGWAACFIGLTWILVRWGALGLAGARLGAYIVHATWTFVFAFIVLKQKRAFNEP